MAPHVSTTFERAVHTKDLPLPCDRTHQTPRGSPFGEDVTMRAGPTTVGANSLPRSRSLYDACSYGVSASCSGYEEQGIIWSSISAFGPDSPWEPGDDLGIRQRNGWPIRVGVFHEIAPAEKEIAAR